MISFVICLEQPYTTNQIQKKARGLCCLTKGPLTHQRSSRTDSIRVTSDKDQKIWELEKIDFSHTQRSEAH